VAIKSHVNPKWKIPRCSRKYPKFSRTMTTADYIEEFTSMNKGANGIQATVFLLGDCHCKNMKKRPILYANEALDFEVITETIVE